MSRAGDWFLNAVEWLFLPMTYHERKRLDPKTEAFKAKMRAIEDTRCGPSAAVPPPESVEKHPDPERGGIALESLRFLLILVVVFNALATAGSGCWHPPTTATAAQHAPRGYTTEQVRLWRKCVEAGRS